LKSVPDRSDQLVDGHVPAAVDVEDRAGLYSNVTPSR